jgi:outer membrane murein-binding lipoprotein Lpp
MKSPIHLITTLALIGSSILFSSCSTSGVQDARASALSNRQDRMDSRASARQARWQERAEREDARAQARFDSW